MEVKPITNGKRRSWETVLRERGHSFRNVQRSRKTKGDWTRRELMAMAKWPHESRNEVNKIQLGSMELSFLLNGWLLGMETEAKDRSMLNCTIRGENH